MRCWRRWILMAWALAICAAAHAAEDVLPQSGAVAGWSRQGEPRSFTPKNLWEYIDGAADLFLSYGFAGLDAAQYAKDGSAEPSVTIDVYDMGMPLNAFGAFTSERGEGVKPLAVGAQGYSGDGLAAFWKGRYYVKIAVLDDDDAGEAADALAARTAARLTGTTALPGELERLPAGNRVAGSERYVRKDALGHKALANVISADYRVSKATATVHIADLATGSQAKQAWEKLREFEKRAGSGFAALKGVGEAGFAVRDSGYGEMAVARSGRFVVIAASEKAGRGAVTGLLREAVLGLGRDQQPK